MRPSISARRLLGDDRRSRKWKRQGRRSAHISRHTQHRDRQSLTLYVVLHRNHRACLYTERTSYRCYDDAVVSDRTCSHVPHPTPLLPAPPPSSELIRTHSVQALFSVKTGEQLFAALLRRLLPPCGGFKRVPAGHLAGWAARWLVRWPASQPASVG